MEIVDLSHAILFWVVLKKKRVRCERVLEAQYRTMTERARFGVLGYKNRTRNPVLGKAHTGIKRSACLNWEERTKIRTLRPVWSLKRRYGVKIVPRFWYSLF